MAKKNQEEQKPPKLTVPEIIDHCKNDLGITFKLMDEEKASAFLQKHNFFFRLKQYASTCGERTKSGKYIGLDFGHLVELSTIDMFFRKIILKMTIDLEHYLKVKIVNDCQSNPADDGYEAVRIFLDSNPKTKESVETGFRFTNYAGIDSEDRMSSPAVWNFVEMISFHDFIAFYKFYYDFFRLQCEYTKHFESVRRLRNAAAHNTCMLCSFKPAPKFKSDLETNFELLQGNIGIGNGVISTFMKVPVLNDFAVMLSVYTRLVTSPKIREISLQEIKDFFDGRMVYRRQYFEDNAEIKNAYQFARKILDYYASK